MNNARSLPQIPTWSKWSPEVLRQEQRTNPRSFALGFQMRVFTDDELMYPSFKKCFTHGVVLGDIQRRRLPAFIGVDLASDKRPGNVIFVVGLDRTNQRRYILEPPMFGAWKSHETAGHLADLASRHDIRFIMVENNAYQQAIIDWIKHSVKDFSFWHKVEPFTTGKNKADPHYGLPSLEVEFKNQAWVIPADEFEGHDPACQCGWCLWVRQVTLYPRGAATDSVMAMWFAREAIDKWGGFGSSKVDLSGFNSR